MKNIINTNERWDQNFGCKKQVPLFRPLSINFNVQQKSGDVRSRLHQASASMLQQLCSDTYDSVLFANSGATWKWEATPFWSDSIVFNENRIANVIAALMLTLDVNGTLKLCTNNFSINIMNCLDIDECTEDERVDCGAHAECYNSIGGYTCVCFNGYEKNEHGQCQGMFRHMCTRPLWLPKETVK